MSSSQNVFSLRINVRQIAEIIKFGARNKRSVFFFGGAGVGKSQKVAQCAEDLFPLSSAHGVFGNMVDVRLSDKEPQDVTGIPVPVQLPNGETRTVYATPSFWPTDPNWKGIVFLDELTNAQPAVQQAAYQIMLDRTIGEYKFPEGAVMVGAGNREGDGGATSGLLSPLANRMVIAEVDYDHEIWIEDFAIPTDVHGAIIGFIKEYGIDKFYTGDKLDENQGVSFATPRSWVAASDALHELDKGLISRSLAAIIIQGSVGNGMDSEVLDYYQRASRLPKFEKVLNGEIKEHALARDEIDLLYVMTQGCMSLLRKDVDNDDMTDDEVLARFLNFLTFIHENYGTTNMDIIVSVVVNLFRGSSANKKSIIDANPKRTKMKPRLMAAGPIVGTIVQQYMADYSDLMEDLDGAR